jgi:Flp pilus assembly secretin CpaC
MSRKVKLSLLWVMLTIMLVHAGYGDDSLSDSVFFDESSAAANANTNNVDQPVFGAPDPTVTLPPQLTVFDAVEHIFANIPLHLNYLELMKTNEVAAIKETRATFFTDKPMSWRQVLREVVDPHGLDFIEDGDMVRLGSVAAVDARYQQIEQDELRRNRNRINVNFSEGVPLYPALGLIRNLARVNMNFDWMDPVDRGVVLSAETTNDEGDEQAPKGPPPKLTTYATPEGQPIEWRVVMREVLSPHDYDFVEVHGVVRPMKKANADAWRRQQVDAKPLVSKTILVHHMDPAQLVARIQAMNLFKHSGASIQVAHGWDSNGKTVGIARNASPPAVVLRDTEENIDRVLAEIKKLDTRGRQIMIEARILDIGRGASRELGMLFNQFGGSVNLDSSAQRNYSRNRSRTYAESLSSDYEVDRFVSQDRVRPDNNDAGNTLNMSMNETFSNARQFGQENAWGMAYDLMLNPLQLSAAWKMLQTADDVKVVSQPVLVLSDHAESFIRVETEIPYLETTITYQENQIPIKNYTWHTVDAGVSLRVIPEITADGKSVRLSVLPTITEVIEMKVGGDEGERTEYPILAVRELDTRVTVESGYTLLMGGLISARADKGENKIPFLGDIPIIGWLFRRESKGGDQRNLVMLITPTILDEDAPDTGYERVSEPHFHQLKQNMQKTMLDGIDEELMRKIDEKLYRAIEADNEETASKQAEVEVPVTFDDAQTETIEMPPTTSPEVDKDLEQRMIELEAAVLEDLEP